MKTNWYLIEYSEFGSCATCNSFMATNAQDAIDDLRSQIKDVYIFNVALILDHREFNFKYGNKEEDD